ncbi:unnamed protein product [Closterium sp. NIES-54]
MSQGSWPFRALVGTSSSSPPLLFAASSSSPSSSPSSSSSTSSSSAAADGSMSRCPAPPFTPPCWPRVALPCLSRRPAGRALPCPARRAALLVARCTPLPVASPCWPLRRPALPAHHPAACIALLPPLLRAALQLPDALLLPDVLLPAVIVTIGLNVPKNES